jgi:hypothetical protein
MIFPFNVRSQKGELADLLEESDLLILVVSLTLNNVSSAFAPSIKLAVGKLKICLALLENNEAILSSVNVGSFSKIALKQVSIQAIPALAFSNSIVFPSQSCGR